LAFVSAHSYSASRPSANDVRRRPRDAVAVKDTEQVMTSNLRSTNGDEGIQRGADKPSAAQPPERPRRPAPAANRPAATPVATGLSTRLEPSPKGPADFEPSSSRQALIATAAYYRAEKRGFQPGHELQDWLAAEREIDRVGSDPL
jgi:hypothetical protein